MLAKYTPPSKQVKNKSRKRRQRRRDFTLTRAPAGFGATVRASTRLIQRDDGSATLITQEIFPIPAKRSGVSFMLPATPTKWLGTRAQTLASTYTSFRPLSVELRYLPTVSSASAGYVSIGTVFDGTRIPNGTDNDELARALAATNGGFITSCWQPAASHVGLGRNLRANTFPLYDVQDDDIPFWIVANASTSAPGYLLVRCRMTLHNPAAAVLTPLALSIDVYGSDNVTGGIELNANVDNASSVLTVGQAVALKLGVALNSVTPAMKTIYAVVKHIASGVIKLFVNTTIQAGSIQTLGFIFLRAAFAPEPIPQP